MIYVYGAVRAGHPAPDQPGLGRPARPVRVVDGDGLAALVSDLDGDPDLDETDARAHLEVLTAALTHGPVIPLRFGTLFPDEDQLRRELFDGVASDLRIALDALDNTVELHLDVDDDESEALAAIGNAAPALRAPTGDIGTRIELGREIAQRLVERRRATAEQIVAALRPFAVDDVPRANPTGPQDPVLRWAFLVRRDDIGDFDENVIALRAEYPALSFRYVGPLPAAHFVARRVQEPDEDADPFRGDGSWGW